MSRLRIGYGDDPQTQIGPAVSDKQRQRVLGYLESITVLTGSALASIEGRQYRLGPLDNIDYPELSNPV